MTWLGDYLRRYVGRHFTTKEAQKWLGITRILYFGSAATLAIMVINKYIETRQKQDEPDKNLLLELGRPIIEDSSPAFKKLRLKGVETGVAYVYKPGEGFVEEAYNRDEYLQKLENEALERAREAQRKALAEGRELPPGAIKLI